MPPTESLSMTVTRRSLNPFGRRDPPTTLIRLDGEHDISTASELSETLARAIGADDADVVVDLSEVEFMAAATVGVLLRARELLRMQTRSLVLRSPSRRARRVLELCGDADLLDPGTGAGDALLSWVTVPAKVPSAIADHAAAAFTVTVAGLGTP